MFIDDHRDNHGVEPICKVLPTAPSTYHTHTAIDRDPDMASDRANRDAILRSEDCRLAGVTFCQNRFRHRCSGAGLYDQRSVQQDGLIDHSYRGVQYVSISYTERLAEAGFG
ncbi:MAG: hypothetical protein GY761_17515 [Hyphomicrobiales bacterium]|nr:hypothetical protein [Hyphomicrobiales bacterium]